MSDPDQDLDDEMADPPARPHREGLVNCEAVYAIYSQQINVRFSPRDSRLSWPSASVGVGSDGGSNKHLDTFAILQHYMPQETELVAVNDYFINCIRQRPLAECIFYSSPQ